MRTSQLAYLKSTVSTRHMAPCKRTLLQPGCESCDGMTPLNRFLYLQHRGSILCCMMHSALRHVEHYAEYPALQRWQRVKTPAVPQQEKACHFLQGLFQVRFKALLTHLLSSFWPGQNPQTGLQSCCCCCCNTDQWAAHRCR
jgi:hypothetical protein